MTVIKKANPNHHLAQINVARAVAELDQPEMKEFVDQIDRINSLADHSPGFVWRFQAEEGHTYDIRLFEDKLVLFNMSVWEDVDSLRQYVYHSSPGHKEVFKNRAKWFLKPDQISMAMWWVKKNHIPTIEEGLAKLEELRKNGSSEEVFSFKDVFT